MPDAHVYDLEWMPLGETYKRQKISYAEAEGGRITFKLPEGLPFGQLVLDKIPVTGYFSPDDPNFEWVLRPYILGTRKETE